MKPYMGRNLTKENLQVCYRCIYDESIPAIKFDENGVCNYCKLIDQLKEEYKTGTPSGEVTILEIFDQIKKEGKEKNTIVLLV